MKKSLFHSSGRFYKANLHTHTTISDGSCTPEEVKALYKADGYEILAYSDHEIMVPHDDLRDDGFLPITSVECELKQYLRQPRDPKTGETLNPPYFLRYGQKYHFIFYAPRPDETYTPWVTRSYVWGNARDYLPDDLAGEHLRDFSARNANAAIRDAKEHGFLVCYCHPFWSCNRYDAYSVLEGLDFVETFNTGSYRGGFLLDDSDRAFDDLLALGKHVAPVCSDDSHGPSSACGAATYVKADALTYDDVFRSLQNGDIFASNASHGAVFNDIAFDPEARVLSVDTSPVRFIAMTTGLCYTKTAGNPDSGTVTHAEFDLTNFIENVSKYELPDEQFVRITLIDENGKKTYSRGYFLPELLNL